MKNLPRCSEAELRVLQAMTVFMRAAVWTGSGASVEQLLWRWQQVAETAGDYQGSIDAFTYALTSRDALEFIIQKCPRPHADVLRRLVEEADERFRAATRDDGGESLSRYFKPAGTTWWNSRRPFSGPLSTYLEEGEYRK